MFVTPKRPWMVRILKGKTEHTVAEIRITDKIIKKIWYYWTRGYENQMLKILEWGNVWFSRIPYFRANFCSTSFSFTCIEQVNEKLSIFNCSILGFYSEKCKLTANSMQISILIFWAFDFHNLPFNNIKKILSVILISIQ